MKITNEDIEQIEKFEKIMQKGYYANGKEVTDLYNRVFEQKLSSTSCSSCLRHRISKLVQAKNKYLEQLQKTEEAEIETKNNEDLIEKSNEQTKQSVDSKSGSDTRERKKKHSKA